MLKEEQTDGCGICRLRMCAIVYAIFVRMRLFDIFARLMRFCRAPSSRFLRELRTFVLCGSWKLKTAQTGSATVSEKSIEFAELRKQVVVGCGASCATFVA